MSCPWLRGFPQADRLLTGRHITADRDDVDVDDRFQFHYSVQRYYSAEIYNTRIFYGRSN